MDKLFSGHSRKQCVFAKRGIFFLIAAVLVAGTALFGFTGEKMQKIEVQKKEYKNLQMKNIGCESEELNPLRSQDDPVLTGAVKEHFEKLQDEETFVERYDDIHVYTKTGQYKDTYIVFAEYRMKIRDIYTEVPGLAVLYAARDKKSGQCRVEADLPQGEEQSYVQTLTSHRDVGDLLKHTEETYQAAVQSDALLAEALADLQKAYKS